MGGAVGIALGGIVAQWLGWRAAFWIVGTPGLLLGLSALKLPNTPVPTVKERLPLRELFRVPAYLMLLLSASFSSFAGYSYVAWGPDFVQEYKGFSSTESGVTLGLTCAARRRLRNFWWGATISDWLSRKRKWAPLGGCARGICAGCALHFLCATCQQQAGIYFFFSDWEHFF